MIVVDKSAIMAVIPDESGADAFRHVLSLQNDVRLSAVTDFEARLLAFSRGGQRLVADYEQLLDVGAFSVEAFARQEAVLAFDAYCRFGWGNHPARLTFGDCAVRLGGCRGVGHTHRRFPEASMIRLLSLALAVLLAAAAPAFAQCDDGPPPPPPQGDTPST